MTNVNLSDGEWKIMNTLWEREAATITELTAVLQGETGWDKHIIITMLNRMSKKGAVSWRTVGRAKQFYPVVSRNEVSIRETRGFLNKVYRGSIGMMVNAMVEDKAQTLRISLNCMRYWSRRRRGCYHERSSYHVFRTDPVHYIT